MDNVNKSNSVVDRKRLDWLNSQHIKHAMSAVPDAKALFMREQVLPALQVCGKSFSVASRRCGSISEGIDFHMSA